MDLNLELKNLENSMRDIISLVLSKKIGKDWESKCNMPEGRILNWRNKKEIEEKRIGNSDSRLIYYSDFYDLRTIISKNWDNEFKKIFHNKKEFEVLYEILEKYRNPEAHRRELLPFQRHLVIGICGKLRTSITKYFSEMETGKSYYPRFEYIQDNFNNSWDRSKILNKHQKTVVTSNILRVGDKIEFTLTANDPKDGKLSFTAYTQSVPYEVTWQENNHCVVTVKEKDIGSIIWVNLVVKSERKYHAMGVVGVSGKVDDVVRFAYEVIPPEE